MNNIYICNYAIEIEKQRNVLQTQLRVENGNEKENSKCACMDSLLIAVSYVSPIFANYLELK